MRMTIFYSNDKWLVLLKICGNINTTMKKRNDSINYSILKILCIIEIHDYDNDEVLKLTNDRSIILWRLIVNETMTVL